MSGPNDESMGDILADAKKQRATFLTMLTKVQRDGVEMNFPLSVEQTIAQVTQEIT